MVTNGLAQLDPGCDSEPNEQHDTRLGAQEAQGVCFSDSRREQGEGRLEGLADLPVQADAEALGGSQRY